MVRLRQPSLLLLLVGASLPLLLSGCSSSDGSSNGSRYPNKTSRQNILKQVGRQQVAMSQNGVQGSASGGGGGVGGGGGNAPGMQGSLGALLFMRPMGIGGGGGGASGGGGAPGASGGGFGVGVVNGGVFGRSAKNAAPRLPFIGAFMMNVVTRHAGRPNLVAKRAVRTREEVDFYYDDYLALWVSIDTTVENYGYYLFEDQEKTKPAGKFTSTYPTDPNIFPQVYSSEYSITAGVLKGSGGHYETSINSDGSGTSSYSNNLVGIYSDHGSSTWNIDGSSTWTAHSQGSDGSTSDYSGEFSMGGTGHTLSSDSTGHSNEYYYNPDGTGHGTIKGPEPGLPATIEWDNTGTITITWADGTKEVITPSWVEGNTETPPPGSDGTSGGGGGTSNGGGSSSGGTTTP